MSSINIQGEKIILARTFRKWWIGFYLPQEYRGTCNGNARSQKNDLSPKIFSDLLYRTEINFYNQIIHHELEVPFVRMCIMGVKVSHMEYSSGIKEENSLKNFIKLIKKWIHQTCSCRLCQGYIPAMVLSKPYSSKCTLLLLILVVFYIDPYLLKCFGWNLGYWALD